MKTLQLNNNLEMINDIESKYGEFFFLFDVEKLRKNYLEMQSVFRKRYPRFIIGYSYKTNYLPALVKELSKLGAYAEVVSKLEYDLALKIGNEPSRIIYNGPLKAYEDIAVALEENSIINLDSFYELELVKEYVEKNKRRTYKVGLRVNFELTIDGESIVQDGFQRSRFGFCFENGNLEKALLELNSISNLDVVGLHGHLSTNIRSTAVYENITQKLCDIAKKYFAHTLEYIDVGGGFYGNVPEVMKVKNVPSFDDYAEAICSIMNKEKSNFKNEPLLIIEPGMSMVVDTFKFYCKVMDVKKIGEEFYVLANGSVHNINPTLHKKEMAMEHVKKGNECYERGTFNVVGYTCMERDYLKVACKGEIPKRGDFLVFSNVGAYTIVLNPPFSKGKPPIIAQDGNKLSLVRKPEGLEEFINDEVYVF